MLLCPLEQRHVFPGGVHVWCRWEVGGGGRGEGGKWAAVVGVKTEGGWGEGGRWAAVVGVKAGGGRQWFG